MVVKAERPINNNFQRLLGVELNRPISSHKWDSPNHKQRFRAITGFLAVVDQTS